MHKRRFNELTLRLAIRPTGPILIKSGREGGADPRLLDMNFVRGHHAELGGTTVYLPGSSLKGTMRSYAEKIARTLGEGHSHHPPFACNPPGGGRTVGADDYFCGRWLENNRQAETAQAIHRFSCPICRTFGNTAMAGHLRVSDAFPADAAARDAANTTEQRDGVAIDRISGAVAVGPFNLEVVTRGTFTGVITMTNFQLWQLGLLFVVLRDIGRGLVPIGFGKSRGLGSVAVDWLSAEVAYPGRFGPTAGHLHLDTALHGVTGFMAAEEAGAYGYTPEEPLPLPGGATVTADGAYGRYALGWTGAAAAGLPAACVPSWATFIGAWGAE